MQNKKMYENKYSFILVGDKRVQFVALKYKDFSPRAITIYPGFQIELGRSMKEIKDALFKTRLPILIKEMAIPSSLGFKNYQIIRMHTGNVDDKIIANIMEKESRIISVSFNKELKRDSEYRKYNALALGNQLSLPPINIDDQEKLEEELQAQVIRITSLLFKEKGEFKSASCNQGQIKIIMDIDGQVQTLLFIYSRKNNTYDFASISLDK